MRVLLIGETGMGKTVTALTISQFFNTIYYDTEGGTELWLSKYKVNGRVIQLREWFKDMLRVFESNTADLVVLDSISTLLEHYTDYLQKYIRQTGKFPLPTAGVMSELRIDPEFVVLPMQVYPLIYDTMLNVVDAVSRVCKHCIIVSHPIETRQLSIDGRVVHSHGRHKYLQGLCRRADIILKFVKPMTAQVVKCRGVVNPPNEVNPIEFLKQLMGVKE